jgi:hypothetical protein
MAEELSIRAEAAAEYDRAFAHVSTHFVPFLTRAANLAPGMQVLDIATGMGLRLASATAAVARLPGQPQPPHGEHSLCVRFGG